MPVDPKEKIDLGFAIDVAGLAQGIKALSELQRQLINIASAAKGVDSVGDKFRRVRDESSAVDVAVSSLAGTMKSTFNSGKTALDPLVSSMAGYSTETSRSSNNINKFGAFLSTVAGAAKTGTTAMSRGWSSVASGVGSARETLSGLSSSLKSELSGVKDGLMKIEGTVSDAIGGLKNLLVSGLALAGIGLSLNGIKDAFMDAFEIGKDLETMTVKMTNKFGSAAFAEKATGFINDMSQEYGLSKDELGSYVDELARAGVSLDSMNFKGVLEAAMGPGQDLSTTMSAITDVAKNPGNFQAFAETFGNQIDPAAFQQAIDGATTYQERMTKISDFLGENFEGNTDRFKDSAEGQITSLMGFFEKIKQTIASSGVFDAMKEVLGNISKWVDQHKPAILGVAKAIGGLMGTVVKFIGGLLGNLFKSANSGVGFFEGIQQKIKDIFFPLMFMLAYIGMKIGDMIGKLFKGDLSGAAVDIGDILVKIIEVVGGFINKAFDFISGMIQKIAAQVPKLMPVIMGQISRVMDALVAFVQGLVPKVMNLLPALLTLWVAQIRLKILLVKKIFFGILDIIGTVLDNIPKLIMNIGPVLVKGVNDIINDVYDFFMGLGQRLTTLWPKLLASLTSIFKNLPGILKPILQNLFTKLFALLEDLAPRLFMILYDTLIWVFKSIGDLGPALGSLLSDVIGWLGEWISGLLGKLTDLLMNSDNPFLNFLGSIVESIKNVWDFIVGLVQDILSLAGNLLGDLGDMFGALFSGDFAGAWEAIKSFFGHIWEFIESIFGRVVTFIWNQLQTIWKAITNIFGSAWDWVIKSTGDFIKSIINFFKDLPGKILGIIQSLPSKIMEMLGSGLKILDGLFEKIIDGLFGEGIFDGLKDQMREFINFFIEKYNSLASTLKLTPINIQVNPDEAKKTLKSLTQDLGLQLKDSSRSTDITDYIKKLQSQVAETGISGDSDQGKALQTLTSQMYKLNKEMGEAKSASGKKDINDQLVKVITAFQATMTSNTFSNVQGGLDGAAGSGDWTQIYARMKKEHGTVFDTTQNQVFTERGNATVPIKDGIVKNGMVTPTDPRDTIFATKQPKKAGLIENIMSGAGDLLGGVKDTFNSVISGGKDAWKEFKSSSVGNLISGIFEGVENGTGSISSAASSFMDKFTTMFQGTKIGNPDRGNVVKGTGEFQGRAADEKQLALLGYLDRATSSIVDDQTKQVLNWCAAFVSNVYTDVFGKLSPEFFNSIVKPAIGAGQGATAVGSGFANKSPYFSKEKTPSPFGLFYWGEPGQGHIGLVKDFSGGNTFDSFEGNTTLGGKDSRTGGSFVSKSRNVKWVLGQENGAFVNPNWAAISAFGNGKVAKDFVMKQDGSVQLFEPTDTVFGMRNPEKMFGALLSGQSPDSMKSDTIGSSTDNSNVVNFNFGANSIVIQSSGSERIDAEKLLKEIEVIQRRKVGRTGRSER
jgi:phage-related protein